MEPMQPSVQCGSSIGAMVVPLNPSLATPELQYMLRHSEATCAITIEQDELRPELFGKYLGVRAGQPFDARDLAKTYRALLGSQAIPPRCGAVALYHTQTAMIHETQVMLCHGMALFGCHSIPPCRCAVVLQHPAAKAIQNPEVVLRRCITCFSVDLPTLECPGILSATRRRKAVMIIFSS